MRKALLSILAIALCCIGPVASADIAAGTITIKDNATGAIIANRARLVHVIYGPSIVSSSGTAYPFQITIGFIGPAGYAKARIRSAEQVRVADFHRALQTSMQSGRFDILVWATTTEPNLHDATLETNLMHVLQY